MYKKEVAAETVTQKVAIFSVREKSEYINLIKNGNILYFDTPEERDTYNVAESVYNGGDPLVGWYGVGEDATGYNDS